MQKPDIESEYKHVLTDITHSLLCCHVHRLPISTVLCCHSNKTHAPIANQPNSAWLGGTPTILQLTSRYMQ